MTFPQSLKEIKLNLAKNLSLFSGHLGYKTAGMLTLAFSDFLGEELATSEVKDWLEGIKLPSVYYLYNLGNFLNTSLDILFSEQNITMKLEETLASQTIITKDTNTIQEPIMATNNTSISITKAAKKSMTEVVRSRTTSTNFNLLLANKIYSSDMTLKMIASKTGASTRSLRDYAFYGTSVPANIANKLATVLKTSPRNLGLEFNADTDRYNHVKITVKK